MNTAISFEFSPVKTLMQNSLRTASKMTFLRSFFILGRRTGQFTSTVFSLIRDDIQIIHILNGR